MSFVFLPSVVIFSGTTFGRPVLRSTPVDQFICTNGCATRTSPVARSIV
jgi:hypothetical protein